MKCGVDDCQVGVEIHVDVNRPSLNIFSHEEERLEIDITREYSVAQRINEWVYGLHQRERDTVFDGMTG